MAGHYRLNCRVLARVGGLWRLLIQLMSTTAERLVLPAGAGIYWWARPPRPRLASPAGGADTSNMARVREPDTEGRSRDPVGVRIAIVDDHPLVCAGLGDLLAGELGVEVVYAGANLEFAAALEPPPALVVLDLDLGGRSASPKVAAELMSCGTLILVLSALGSAAAIREMMQVGVAGFVSKAEPPEVLVEAVATVLTDGAWTGPEVAAAIAGDPSGPALSPQELRVLVLYASGLKLEAVARQAGITPGTAKTYLKRIRAKYAEHGRPAPTKTDLYREARRDGLIRDGEPALSPHPLP